MSQSARGTAVVTGAAQGIGQEIAQTLAEDGSHVTVVDIEDGSETVEQIREEGGDALFRYGDVTDPDSMKRAFEDLSINVLVNNAGYYTPLINDKKRFDEISVDEWDTVVDVNAKGVFLATKHALPALQDGATVVNISSGVVIRGTPGLLHYVASKAAVIGMTRAMANELGDQDIRVNAVMPGLVTTDRALEEVDDPDQRVAAGQTLNRPIEPTDIANTVRFLCGEDSEMITGQVINVDGGTSFY